MANIAVCGTFDVENYGDCLFPIVAAHRLGAAGHTVTAVSPTSGKTRWTDAYAPIAVADVGREPQLGASIIGGGNIIHNHSGGLPEYREAGINSTAYASLWVGSTIASILRNIPVAWNAPGVMNEFNPADAKYLVPNYLAAADYVAVRDAASKAFLGSHHQSKVHIVPDTAVEICDAWPKSSLDPVFRTVLDRLGAPRSVRYITVHIKKRAMTNEAAGLVEGLEGICKRLSATPILVGLAPCHDDDDAVRTMSKQLKIPHVMLDNAASMKEIASAIAMSDAYIGPSLHGYITSYSYGVPSALVARPKLEKFLGFTEQVGRQEDVVASWAAALAHIEPRIGRSVRTPETDAFLKAALDGHWGKVTAMVDGGPRESSAHRLDRVLRPLTERQEDIPFDFRKLAKKALKRAGIK